MSGVQSSVRASGGPQNRGCSKMDPASPEAFTLVTILVTHISCVQQSSKLASALMQVHLNMSSHASSLSKVCCDDLRRK